jgi:hypothetical protein
MRYLILLGVTAAWALSATRCIDITPGGGFQATTRWEGYTMMYGIDPVVVVNNDGMDSPFYWDGKIEYFIRCVEII